jgi:outer membrane protein assembly factor BamD (BamD/ComL family)
MLATPNQYSVEEFRKVGQEMLDKQQWKEAITAFERVIASNTDDRRYLEGAFYGIGSAKYELRDYAGATAAMTELMRRWPKSALFYKANFIIARANIKHGEYEEATQALNNIFKYAYDDPELMNSASLDLADIYLLEAKRFAEEGNSAGARGRKNTALLTYKRLEWMEAPKNPVIAKQMETAILNAVRLGMELEQYSDVIESCDKFQECFPTNPRLPDIRKIRSTALVKVSVGAAESKPPEAK